MLELRYIELDENGFITSISTQETETSISVYLDPNSEMALGFRKYRFDTETEEFIYDESNVIDECKEALKMESEYILRRDRNTQFGVKLSVGNFTFDYNEELKNMIANNNGLIGLGITDLFKVPCVNENGEKTNIKLNVFDLTKLLKAIVEFANYLEDVIEQHRTNISEFTSIAELTEYRDRNNLSMEKHNRQAIEKMNKEMETLEEI